MNIRQLGAIVSTVDDMTITVDQVTKTSMRVAFDIVEDFTHYRIELQSQTDASWTGGSVIPEGDAVDGTITQTLAGLTPGTAYQVSVVMADNNLGAVAIGAADNP